MYNSFSKLVPYSTQLSMCLYRILYSIFSQIITKRDCFARFAFPLLINKCSAVYILNLFHFKTSLSLKPKQNQPFSPNSFELPKLKKIHRNKHLIKTAERWDRWDAELPFLNILHKMG